jgi:plastocyanin
MTFVHRIWRLGLVAGLLLVALAAISPALAAGGSVNIVDKTFDPPTITVGQGETVTWTVTKAIGEPHTVTSGKSSDADKGSLFDSSKSDPDLSKLKEVGGTFSFTFATAGTYDYFCTIHAGMTGQVIVLAPGQSAPAGPTATPEPAAGAGEGIAPERRLIGAAILVVTLVVLFGAAMLYRRMNPA